MGMLDKIQKREIALLLFFYLFMAINYYAVLVIDTGIVRHKMALVMNYSLKALLSIPIWWLFFKGIASFPIWKKIIVHTITLVAFTVIWVSVYYGICDYFGFYRLTDSRMVWDYYLTGLFYIIQFGSMHLYVYYKELQEQQLIAAQLGKLSLQSELSALKAQLNPHFLYNVFNTINAAIPSSANYARDMVNKLSDLFRYQLKASREERVTVEEELDFVRKYLDLEKERFGERLQYQFTVGEDGLKEKIPPLIFQPIVENAVKHGISPLIHGGKITMSVTKDEDCLNISIKDNGSGIADQSKSDLLKQGVGLSNTEERLKKMYGKGLELCANTPQGLIVKFSLPLIHEIEKL